MKIPTESVHERVKEFFPMSNVCNKVFRKCFEHKLHPAGNYMFKIDNRNTRTSSEVCPKLTIKTPKLQHWRCSGVFIVNFENISHLVLVLILLTLSR